MIRLLASCCSKHNPQSFQATQSGGLTPLRRRGCVLQPRHEGPDRDLTLQARQRRTEAEVDAEAERDVTIVAPRDVEAVWIGKVSRIAIGCADRGDHH